MKIDIGSGYIVKQGFLRVDGDPLCKPDILCMADNLTIEDNTVEELHAFHLLEHFDNEYTFNVLREWNRVIQKGGIIVLKVPDIEQAMKDYVFEKISWNCFHKILWGANPTANEFMHHKNSFSKFMLKRYLTITGFTDIYIKSGNYEITATAIKG